MAQKPGAVASPKDSLKVSLREAVNRQRMENYVKLLEAHSREEVEKDGGS